jgi:hypothetical protein
VLGPLREIFNPGYFAFLLKNLPQTAGGELPEFLLNEAEHKMDGLVKGAQALLPELPKAVASKDKSDFKESLRRLNAALWIDINLALREDIESSRMMTMLRAELHEENELALLSWTYLEGLRDALGMGQEKFAQAVEEWRFQPLLEEALRGMGIPALSPGKAVQSLRLLLNLQGWAAQIGRRGADQLAGELLANADVRHYLQFNIYDGKRWFNREAFESFWAYLAMEGVVELLSNGKPAGKQFHARLEKLARTLNHLRKTAQEANYEEESWLEALGKPGDQA